MNNQYNQQNYNSQYNRNFVTYVPYGFTPETYEEKKGIRKLALIIGFSLLATLGISLIWGTIYFFITGKFGISRQQAYDIVMDPAVLQFLQIALSIFMFAVPSIIIFKANHYYISDLVLLKKPEKRLILPLFLLGISFCSFANIATSQASQFFTRFGINYNVDAGENPKGTIGFILVVLSTAITPPLIEEFTFRGVFLGALRKYGDGFALFASSLLFGLMHGNFEQIPFAFLVGLVLAFITIKSGSIIISIAVHSFNNFVSIIFNYCINSLSSSTQNIIYYIFLSICLILGIISVLMLTNIDKNIFKFEKSNTKLSETKKLKYFFSSAVIIIFIVINIIISCSYFV